MKRPALIILWVIVWVPLSFLFQNHPHFPSALLAPMMGFAALGSDMFYQGRLNWNLIEEMVFPWAVFWGVIVLIVVMTRRKKTGPQEPTNP